LFYDFSDFTDPKIAKLNPVVTGGASLGIIFNDLMGVIVAQPFLQFHAALL